MATQSHFIVSKKIIAWLFVYNIITWALFTLAYLRLDFKTDFEVPPTFEQTFDTVAYFAWQVQTQMFGTNIVPKTQRGRALVAVHGLFAWSQTIVFLAPWLISHRHS